MVGLLLIVIATLSIAASHSSSKATDSNKPIITGADQTANTCPLKGKRWASW